MLESLVLQLQKAKSIPDKIRILDQCQEVLQFQPIPDSLKLEEQFVLKSMIALGQGPTVFHKSPIQISEELSSLIQTLLEVEKFYASIGGIIGYHLTVLKLIVGKKQARPLSTAVHYHMPVGLDLTKDSPEVRKAVRWGIEAVAHMGEMYPVGGSGDRLHLHDDTTGVSLPVAELCFCGLTLLEGLIRDLQGKEYVHYKINGRQVMTPIAMMTSLEKENHTHIRELCEKKQWFGRSPAHFKLFTQPLVPVITARGDWVAQAPLKLMLKPSGHGVIWKLAQEKGVLDWLVKNNCQHVLVRQINNPVASTDHGILGFVGLGSHYKKGFGFASCFRLLNSAEGMDILIEEEKEKGFEYRISNIEYTEFEQYGLQDTPESPGNPYSRFPSNTNILFADLKKIKSIVNDHPIPGLLINMKTTVSVPNAQGVMEHVAIGRLESTMQNISDFIVDRFPQRPEEIRPMDLSTYITFNERRKTVSVTKKEYVGGESLLETPEGCFYELLQNHYDLFTNYCRMEVPQVGIERDYLEQGPAFVTSFHPALGPLYEVIEQKIQKGVLKHGSELQLEIAELQMENLHLDGSLLIVADSVLGKKNRDGHILYSEDAGKCILRNVSVKNRGIDRAAANQYWSHRIARHERVRILLWGNAEFFAENVTFAGPHEIEVPDGHRMTAQMDKGEIRYRLEKINAPTWHWKYEFDAQDRIQLKQIFSGG